MIDFDTFYEILKEWGGQQIDKRFVKRDEASEYRNTTKDGPVFGTLHVISVRNVGRDEIRYTALPNPLPNRDLQLEICGNRIVGVDISVHSRDQRPQNDALVYVEKLKTSFRKPTVLDTFFENNISFVRMGETTDRSTIFDDRWESIAGFVAEFGVGISEIDQREEVGTIETVLLSSEIYDADGELLPDSLQLNNKEISG